MRDRDVEIGGVYAVKVGDRVVPVRILHPSPWGGWYGENLRTGRRVQIRSGRRLRYRVDGGGNDGRRA
jgi:hypothetical protein